MSDPSTHDRRLIGAQDRVQAAWEEYQRALTARANAVEAATADGVSLYHAARVMGVARQTLMSGRQVRRD